MPSGKIFAECYDKICWTGDFSGKLKNRLYILFYNTEKAMANLEDYLQCLLEQLTAYLILNLHLIGFFIKPHHQKCIIVSWINFIIKNGPTIHICSDLMCNDPYGDFGGLAMAFSKHLWYLKLIRKRRWNYRFCTMQDWVRHSIQTEASWGWRYSWHQYFQCYSFLLSAKHNVAW